MPTQDVDVGSPMKKRKLLSNREKLSILLDTVTPKEK